MPEHGRNFGCEQLISREALVRGLRDTYGVDAESAERAADRTLGLLAGSVVDVHVRGPVNVGIVPGSATRAADRTLGGETHVSIAQRNAATRAPLLTEIQRGVPPSERSARHAVDPDELHRLEKDIEHECDKLMRAVGFEVIRFSHPGKTKQTPGIPDRRYYHRDRKLSAWLEVKAPNGQQRPDQRVFQEMCEAVGETYLLGGLAVLRTWLAGRRVCVFGVDNTPIPLPISEQVQ